MGKDIQKIAWLIAKVIKLMNDGFSGTLIVDFHKGDVSKKHKIQVVEIDE